MCETLLHVSPELAALEREIATEAARCDLECLAIQVRPGTTRDMPWYDVDGLATTLTDAEILCAERACLTKALRYLELRGLLVRPVKGSPNIVAISADAQAAMMATQCRGDHV